MKRRVCVYISPSPSAAAPPFGSWRTGARQPLPCTWGASRRDSRPRGGSEPAPPSHSPTYSNSPMRSHGYGRSRRRRSVILRLHCKRSRRRRRATAVQISSRRRRERASDSVIARARPWRTRSGARSCPTAAPRPHWPSRACGSCGAASTPQRSRMPRARPRGHRQRSACWSAPGGPRRHRKARGGGKPEPAGCGEEVAPADQAAAHAILKLAQSGVNRRAGMIGHVPPLAVRSALRAQEPHRLR